jgi:hypothetical protein
VPAPQGRLAAPRQRQRNGRAGRRAAHAVAAASSASSIRASRARSSSQPSPPAPSGGGGASASPPPPGSAPAAAGAAGGRSGAVAPRPFAAAALAGGVTPARASAGHASTSYQARGRPTSDRAPWLKGPLRSSGDSAASSARNADGGATPCASQMRLNHATPGVGGRCGWAGKVWVEEGRSTTTETRRRGPPHVRRSRRAVPLFPSRHPCAARRPTDRDVRLLLERDLRDDARRAPVAGADEALDEALPRVQAARLLAHRHDGEPLRGGGGVEGGAAPVSVSCSLGKLPPSRQGGGRGMRARPAQERRPAHRALRSPADSWAPSHSRSCATCGRRAARFGAARPAGRSGPPLGEAGLYRLCCPGPPPRPVHPPPSAHHVPVVRPHLAQPLQRPAEVARLVVRDARKVLVEAARQAKVRKPGRARGAAD